MQPGMIYIRKASVENTGRYTYVTFDFNENNIDPSLIRVEVAFQYNDRMYIIDEVLPSGKTGLFKVRAHTMG